MRLDRQIRTRFCRVINDSPRHWNLVGNGESLNVFEQENNEIRDIVLESFMCQPWRVG